jgi:hypothetical protein
MESSIINQFPIRDYLAGSGIQPVRDNGWYGMYHSPLRADHNASMKVDYSKNLWVDFGTGDGGTLIDLVMRIENCSNGSAMKRLEQRIAGGASFSFQREKDVASESKEQSVPSISILKICDLTHPNLIGYLRERGIKIEIARLHCSEVHYRTGNKSYFAVGFKNDSGGYELRNKYFKGCRSKDVTSITTDGSTCQLFEGFMDYLSSLTITNWQQPKTDVIVLNSLSNLHKVKNILIFYGTVATFLDNDDAGKQAVQALNSVCRVYDQSSFYAKHKDLNDYLCSKKPVQQQPKKRGLRM